MRSGYRMRIALRNTSRHWRRSMAAILSITAGFTALNLFEGYISDTENLFAVTYSQRQMYGDAFIHHSEAFKNGMWDDGMARISKDQQQSVEKILDEAKLTDNRVRFLTMSGMVTNGKTNAVFGGFGYDIEAGRKMRQPTWDWNTIAGHPHQGIPDTVLIGKRLGAILDCTTDPKFKVMITQNGYKAEERPFNCLQKNLQFTATSASGQINAVTAEVVGVVDAIFTELDTRYALLPLEKAQALTGTDGITFYSVRFNKGVNLATAIADLQARFDNANLPMTIINWRHHPYGDIYVRSKAFLNVFRFFTIIVVLTIVTLSVVSTLMRLVQERTREIATLKSIGFKNTQVMSLFLLEGSLLATIGIILGVVVSTLLAYVFDFFVIYYKIGILSEDVPFHIILPGSHLAFSAALLMALALTGTFFATRRALRRKITEGLAHV